MATKGAQTGVSVLSTLLRTSLPICPRPTSEVHLICRNFSSGKLQPPKRPLTAFFDYLAQNRSEIQRNNPGAKVYEVASIAGQMWKDVSPEEKQILKEKANRRMEAYKVQKDKFMSELTPAQKEELVQDKKNHKKKRQHRRKVVELHKLGKPKRPVTPFMAFVRSNKMDRGDALAKDFVKGLAETWKMMPVDEKQSYMQESDKDRNRYFEEMELWEAKMIEAGRPDLLRGYQKKKPAKRRVQKRRTRRRRPQTKKAKDPEK